MTSLTRTSCMYMYMYMCIRNGRRDGEYIGMGQVGGGGVGRTWKGRGMEDGRQSVGWDPRC